MGVTLFRYTGTAGGGRVVRRCWVSFQCRGVLLIWITVGQGPTALAVGAGGGCLDIFLSAFISLFLLPLSGRRPNIDWNIVSKGREAQNNQQTNRNCGFFFISILNPFQNGVFCLKASCTYRWLYGINPYLWRQHQALNSRDFYQVLGEITGVEENHFCLRNWIMIYKEYLTQVVISYMYEFYEWAFGGFLKFYSLAYKTRFHLVFRFLAWSKVL